MAKIRFYTKNILAEATSVIVSGVTDASNPKTRLYDGYRDLLWKATETAVKTITVNQSTIIPVDLLLIMNHNIYSEQVSWQYSANGEDWYDAVAAFFPGSYDQIEKTLAAEVEQYFWRIVITSIQNPKIGELFMGSGYEFQCRFDEGSQPVFGDESNTGWIATVGGAERGTKYGDSRRRRTYSLFLNEPTNGDITKWNAVITDLDNYSKTFVFKDHEGDYFLARLEAPPERPYVTEQQLTLTVSIIEML